MADMFFPPELPKFEYDDDLFFPKELPQIDLPEPEQKEKSWRERNAEALANRQKRALKTWIKALGQSDIARHLRWLALTDREKFTGQEIPDKEKLVEEGIAGTITDILMPETEAYQYPLNIQSALQSGTYRTAGGLLAAPELLASTAYDTVLRRSGIEGGYSDIAESKYNPLKYLSDLSRKAMERSAERTPMKEFDKGIVQNLMEGNFLQAGEQLSYAIAENLPQYLFIATAAATGAPSAGIGVIGASAAGGKYMELEDADITPHARQFNAVVTGLAEMAFEHFIGTGKHFRDLFENKAVRDQVKQGFVESIKPVVRNFVEGAIEEGGAQTVENLADILTQVKDRPEDFKDFLVKTFEGVPDSALVGAIMEGIPGIAEARIEAQLRQELGRLQQDMQVIQDIQETLQQQTQTELAPETAVEETVTTPVEEAQVETQIETEPVAETPAPEIETTPQPEITPTPETETDTPPIETEAEADIMSEIIQDLEGIDSDVDVIETEKYGRLEIVLDDPYQPVVVVRDEDGNTFMLERDALEEMTQAEKYIEEDVDTEEDIPDWEADENYDLEEKIIKIRYGVDPYYLARDMEMDEIIELENYIQERLKDERLPDYKREQYELDLMDIKRVEYEKRSQISDVYTEGETVLELRDEEYFEGKPLEIKNDSDGNEYMETDLDGKEIKVYVDNINQKPEAPAYIEYGPQALEMPELVKLAKDINEGKYPNIVKKRFDSQGRTIFAEDAGQIEIRADIFIGPVVETHRITDRINGKELFRELKNKYNQRDYQIERFSEKGQEYIRVYKKDPNYALQTLAHEIGHVIDWLPDKDIKRGNILGRLASLKKYVKHTLEDPNLGKLERNKIMDELKTLTRLWRPDRK